MRSFSEIRRWPKYVNKFTLVVSKWSEIRVKKYEMNLNYVDLKAKCCNVANLSVDCGRGSIETRNSNVK